MAQPDLPLQITDQNGNVHQVAYDGNMIGKELTKILKERTGMVSNRTTLKKGQKAVQDNKTLADQQISPGDRLVFTWKMNGGTLRCNSKPYHSIA
ncbi:hypothetical protein BLNAU_10259 [Blattamonas nauphoetae]|uniref:Ubiquitin-like domain-containing protein n=1 Tax=Blattamonas nauphoetae TaxID=2049346 RepID=A0ABQ9XTI0_9EUKA|nr:hypothetical protein BLNAU_10259 [Blattamonas nauphoetae]